MLRNNSTITDLIYENIVEKLANLKGISINESKDAISKMSFKQYHKLVEANGANIPSPSGAGTIGPQGTSSGTTVPSSDPSKPPTGKPAVAWSPGMPVLPGATVGVNGMNGKKIPGTVSNVDKSKNTVDVTDDTTGQITTHGINDLSAIAAKQGIQQTQQQPQQPGQQQAQQMEEELSRLKQLAGIAEDGSCGGTGAGAVGGGVPVSLGGTKRRQPVKEVDAVEQQMNGTLAGDIGNAHKASEKLSANLVKGNKPAAGNAGNGKRDYWRK